MIRFPLLLFMAVAGCTPSPAPKPKVVVGAKKFTESIILAQMGARLAREGGADGKWLDLGSTPTLWLALKQGDIDAYPEYTGTITREILKAEPADLDAALAAHGIKVGKSLGYRNNYALGMRKDVAAARNIRTISDLRAHPDLRLGFIPEFLNRPDGWPGVKRHYDLPQSKVQGMNHTLAYQALVGRSIDVMELYTTDGEIAQFDLLVLEDDRRFFPAYEAVWLYRADLETRQPEAVKQLRRLEGRISESAMQKMNSRVQGEGKENEGKIANEFLQQTLGLGEDAVAEETLASRIGKTTIEHLRLVIPSLALAILVAVPLGIIAAHRPRIGRVILILTGTLQTIPSLALLLFMIPLMKWLIDSGTGPAPAIAALFLYSLLPIVRNTHAGMTGIAPSLRESAEALGLTRWAILGRIELPLAAPTIMAGVKTATIINIGGATLGGFIGAGGYGRPILRGLDKFDIPLMLEGAIPAAVMALTAEMLFELFERFVTKHRSHSQ